MLGFLRVYSKCFNQVSGSSLTKGKKLHFVKLRENFQFYLLQLYKKCSSPRINSFTGISNKFIANMLVEKLAP